MSPEERASACGMREVIHGNNVFAGPATCCSTRRGKKRDNSAGRGGGIGEPSTARITRRRVGNRQLEMTLIGRLPAGKLRCSSTSTVPCWSTSPSRCGVRRCHTRRARAIERTDGAWPSSPAAASTVDRLFARWRCDRRSLPRNTGHQRRRRRHHQQARTSPRSPTRIRIRGYQGPYFERKGPVLAIHTRGAPGPPAVRIARGAPGICRRLQDLATLDSCRPALKGTAIRRFMALDAFRDRLPVFIGGDIPDERLRVCQQVRRISTVCDRRPTSALPLANVAAIVARLDAARRRSTGAHGLTWSAPRSDRNSIDLIHLHKTLPRRSSLI